MDSRTIQEMSHCHLTNDLFEQIWDDYEKLLLKLKRNNTIPMDILTTRYEKAYNALINEVRETTAFVMKMLCFKGFWDEDYDVINQILGDKFCIDRVKLVLENICRNPDFDMVEKASWEIREYVLKKLDERYVQMDFMDELKKGDRHEQRTENTLYQT